MLNKFRVRIKNYCLLEIIKLSQLIIENSRKLKYLISCNITIKELLYKNGYKSKIISKKYFIINNKTRQVTSDSGFIYVVKIYIK